MASSPKSNQTKTLDWLTSAIDRVKLGYSLYQYLSECLTGGPRREEILRELTITVEAVVNAVDLCELPLSPKLRDGMQELRDAVYDATDALDSLAYLQLQKEVENANWKQYKKKSGNSLPLLKRKFSELISIEELQDACLPLLKRIISKVISYGIQADIGGLQDAVERIESKSRSIGTYLTLVKSKRQRQQATHDRSMSQRESGIHRSDRLPVIGREGVKTHIVRRLSTRGYGNNNLFLVSIVGMAGMGKTTLAQSVFNDEVAELYDPRVWYDVSPRRCDAIQHATSMLQCVRGGVEPENTRLSSLQDALRTELFLSEKFLLVLDDVCETDSWEAVFATLRAEQARGSTILLTCQDPRFAEALALVLGVDSSHHDCNILEKLSEEDCFSLLKRYAFDGRDPDQQRIQIGWEIARRLGGSPLAAKVVGKYLRFNFNLTIWNRVKNTKIPEIWELHDKIMPTLHMSYNGLSEDLRRCFAYCSIFPQGHLFKREELILLWMASGLIKEFSMERLLDSGGINFDDLIGYSFFEPYSNGYVVPNLLHDLALSVSNGEYFSIVGDGSKNKIKSAVRHLYIHTSNKDLLEKVSKQKDLRTLLLIFDKYSPQDADVFKGMFRTLKSLRVLLLSIDGMDILPDEISNLRHLRYLEIRQSIRQLPKSIDKLYHLQVFKMVQAASSFVFPKKMNNLISLQHLLVPECISGMIAGVGRLTSLEDLSFSIKKEHGYKIGELEGLKDLYELKIRGLENVEDSNEASTVKLQEKEQLRELNLEWESGDSSAGTPSPQLKKLNEEVLNSLKPHSNIDKLTIKGYKGSKLPEWIAHNGVMQNLTYIKLEDCKLKYMYLKNLPAVKEIYFQGGFPQLEVLEIEKLENLVGWSGSGTTDDQWCPCLRKIKIASCPMLKVLPSLPFTLTDMSLDDVGLTAFPALRKQPNIGSSSSASSISSCPFLLSSLFISRCEKLTSFGNLHEAFPHIKKLKIGGCSCLLKAAASWKIHELSATHLSINTPSRLLEVPFKSLKSVQELCIFDCSRLQTFSRALENWLSQNRNSLKHLSMCKARTQHSLPVNLCDLVFLEILKLDGTNELQSVPERPTSLKKLICSETLKAWLEENGHVNWHMIAHTS